MPWREVKVGQILRVNDDELFPADLLCLSSALPDNVCFIKTTNLDGESNLKIRRPIDTTAVPDDSGEARVLHSRGVLNCEGPNADLHNFNGRFDADVVAGEGSLWQMKVPSPELLDICPIPLFDCRNGASFHVVAHAEDLIRAAPQGPMLDLGLKHMHA